MPQTTLSVNINKIALILHSRKIHAPELVSYAERALKAGADGITVHPRNDLRHITPDDVRNLAQLKTELNIEGNPFTGKNNSYPGFMSLVEEIRPTQCTLVPDSPDQITSDHGWDLKRDSLCLEPIIKKLRDIGCRVSLFMDPDTPDLRIAYEIGAERIELYTESFAQSYGTLENETIFKNCLETAETAAMLGLGLNAGHDLDQKNLKKILSLPQLLEVSIGHALVLDALEIGFEKSVSAYKRIIEEANHQF